MGRVFVETGNNYCYCGGGGLGTMLTYRNLAVLPEFQTPELALILENCHLDIVMIVEWNIKV